jgi:DNA-binding NarL/FixJ family response regulator
MMMPEGRRKILCIEDDREMAGLIAEELADRGFDITLAHSGQDGLLSIIETSPDLILCDISMPGMTGFEVLERVKAFEPHLSHNSNHTVGHIPFVFLTALTDRDREIAGRRLGADDYVTKPIDFDRLALIIAARIEAPARLKMLPKLVNLNERESEILTLVARGLTSAEIANKMSLSKRTVDFHIDNARTKLSAETRTEAAIKAAVTGLIKP